MNLAFLNIFSHGQNTESVIIIRSGHVPVNFWLHLVCKEMMQRIMCQ
jgi:hypothetical protein